MVTTLLEAIEQELTTMNPLVRGVTYAHVKSVIGQPREAVAVLEDLLGLMPDNGLIYYQLGCYRRAIQDDDGALAAFTRATELDPSAVDAWIHRGMLLDARAEPSAAVEAYRHAILTKPTEVDAWRNLGNSLAALGHFSEALEAYRTARRLAPEHETIGFLMASAHQALGEIELANSLIPGSMEQTVGRVEEVRASDATAPLVCRFHALECHASARRRAARRLLDTIGEASSEASVRCRAIGDDSFIVRQAQTRILCDADPMRPGHPNRFFDATQIVSREVRLERSDPVD